MPIEEQKTISAMFDRIAPTYDLVNRILSFKQDLKWRKAVAHLLPHTPHLKVLDVATGTADLLLTIQAERKNLSEAYGIDLSEAMLKKGEEKILNLGLSSKLRLQKADAASLPFPDQHFDGVTIAFGIRNVCAMNDALNEFRRVLKKGGSLLVLEFSLPKNKFIRMGYLFYFRYLLPFLGGVISKDPSAYRYLNRSVEAFFNQEEFSKILRASGFKEINVIALSFGIATIYCARKI